MNFKISLLILAILFQLGNHFKMLRNDLPILKKFLIFEENWLSIELFIICNVHIISDLPRWIRNCVLWSLAKLSPLKLTIDKFRVTIVRDLGSFRTYVFLAAFPPVRLCPGSSPIFNADRGLSPLKGMDTPPKQ